MRGLRISLAAMTLSAAALITTSGAFAQAKTSTPNTWDIFGGGSYLYMSGANAYGWDASLSERPYVVHPWIGGTIDFSGAYLTKDTVLLGSPAKDGQSVYHFMGGPSVLIPLHGVHPFARALFGATISKDDVTGSGLMPANNHTSTTSFSYAFGGGVDIPVSKNWALRTQGDWIRTRESATHSSNMARASVGFSYSF